MPPKRVRSVSNLSKNTTTVFSDLWSSRMFLTPNDYSPAAIGIHNCLVRCCQSEHFAKCFYQAMIAGSRTKDFIYQLNEMEKKLKDDCQSNIDRCATFARLRRYLEKNETSFEDILNQIKKHLDECMQECLAPNNPRTYDELTQQCTQRNQLAHTHDRAHRMRRFQFHDHNEANQPVNLINLQTWTQSHFQILVANIRSDSPNRAELLANLVNLLNYSFFIIQHPPSCTIKHSPPKTEDFTADVNCRVLCLLDLSNGAVVIDNITPYVCYSSKLNQMEGSDISYQQGQMAWTTYSVVSTGNNPKKFSCADMSEIVLNQISAVPRRPQPSTGKPRYAPYVYRIDFHINVTVRFPNDPLPFQYCVIVQSAPSGFITNTSQEEELFAKVFIEDLRSWKSIPMSPASVTTSSSTITNLTVIEIANCIKRYFIHRTGIQPKQWVMPYIQQELTAVYINDPNSLNDRFYNVLAKILAQIDYMAKYPLLILFHADGLFLGICDSMLVKSILSTEYERCKKPVSAMRFGSIHHMSNAKAVSVRVDLVDKSSTDVQHCTFETEKLSLELGLFITKIALGEASCFENILFDITEYDQQHLQQVSINIRVTVDLYDSAKLREICPHNEKYCSILNTFDSKQNKKPENSSPSPISRTSQNSIIITAPGASTNTQTYYPCNITTQPINQVHEVMQSSQVPYPQQTQYPPQFQTQLQYYSQSPAPFPVQPFYPSSSHALQSLIESPYNSQNNQQYINSPPTVIVITAPNPLTMSDHDITQLVSQYYPSIQFDRIVHFNLNCPSQPSNVPLQTLQNSIPNLQSTPVPSKQSTVYETYTTDSTNFLEPYDNN